MGDDRWEHEQTFPPTLGDVTLPYVEGIAPIPDALPRGAVVGRYIIVDLLGIGGMAVVHAAFDPTLNRRVAIKLLAQRHSEAGRVRFMREAQAMAQLAHPHVVSVHDVGTFRDRVFLAMDLVAGRSLRAWLAIQERGWREILDVFVQAGRGLAAAHAAGIIHRDFKPDNVLVGDDGTVRVADFGLARATEDLGDEEVAGESANSGTPLGTRLTRTGALVGTPLYMAPEQHRRGEIDARSDQFSFCLALYEALYHQHPFGGRTLAELSERVAAGALRPAPPAKLPGWLAAAVTRGLSLDPALRWPSMQALLDALTAHHPAPKRWSAIVLAVAAAGMGLGALGVLTLDPRGGEPCATPARTGWNAARRHEVQAAFAATGKPFAAAASTEMVRLLDAYDRDLGAMRRDVCRAGADRRQSAEAVELRTMCLDRRQAQLEALSRVAATADAHVVSRAVEAAQALARIEECADVEALRAPRRMPADPAVRRKIVAAQALLAEVFVLGNAGRMRAAIPAAREALAAALATGHTPVIAEVFLLLGTLQAQNGDTEGAEPTLEAAFATALASRHDRHAALAAIRLIQTVSYATPREGDARRWARLARASIERLPADQETFDAILLEALGRLEFNVGRYAEATSVLRRALALTELHARGGLHLAGTIVNLAEALNADGHYDEAQALYDRALALQTALLGPDHPDVAWTRKMIGTLLWARGRWQEARDEYLRAASIVERALGSDTLLMASVLNNLAVVDVRLGRLEDALVDLQRAIAIWEARFGADNPKVAVGRNNLGDAYRRLGRLPEARAELGRARAILEKAFGPDHVRLVPTLASTVELEIAEGKPGAARLTADHALAIAERDLGPEAVERAEALHAAGLALLAQGDAAGATTRFTAALAIYEKARGGDSPTLADTLEPLARALGDAGRRAEAEATRARIAALTGPR